MKDLKVWDPRGWDAIMKNLKTEDAIPLRPPSRRDGLAAKFEATIAYKIALVEQGKSALAVPIQVDDPWTMDDFDMPYDGDEEIVEEGEILTQRGEDETHMGADDELEVISFVGMDPATRKLVFQILLEEGPGYVEAVAKGVWRV
ncbi:hypothetical protein SLS56_000606 [Neofusicoccum ribis]|uniref:Uncharacterized protein n=1 Tax=Neofusicoccum ribis TaxID=45134 RepID=A0ABR3TD22_9PEZI